MIQSSYNFLLIWECINADNGQFSFHVCILIKAEFRRSTPESQLWYWNLIVQRNTGNLVNLYYRNYKQWESSKKYFHCMVLIDSILLGGVHFGWWDRLMIHMIWLSIWGIRIIEQAHSFFWNRTSLKLINLSKYGMNHPILYLSICPITHSKHLLIAVRIQILQKPSSMFFLDEKKRKQLLRSWAMNWSDFTAQPIDDICAYYGMKVNANYY